MWIGCINCLTRSRLYFKATGQKFTSCLDLSCTRNERRVDAKQLFVMFHKTQIFICNHKYRLKWTTIFLTIKTAALFKSSVAVVINFTQKFQSKVERWIYLVLATVILHKHVWNCCETWRFQKYSERTPNSKQKINKTSAFEDWLKYVMITSSDYDVNFKIHDHIY